MKKVLFIDRDGTLIVEPPTDFQIDSLQKLTFIPKIFRFLGKIVREMDYELVMVTNQDGLGTASFPEADFHPPHQKMLETFENEGITFKEIVIDRTFEHDNAPTRKPRTGLLTHYMTGDYDLKNSFTIGDRATDVELAKNLGSKAIFFHSNESLLTPKNLTKYCVLTTCDWEQIYNYLKNPPRTASIRRTTKETDIQIELNLDGTGKADNQTGIGFFDHMLDQLARHSGCNLKVHVEGDLHIDEHHTIEDTALALGEAFKKALGDKSGIERYGYCLPMDDCLAQVALDFGGRSWLVFDATFKREMIGKMPTEMFYHFFKSFCDAAACNMNVQASGTNEHHKIEAIFKAWAKSVKMAIKRDPVHRQLPSTKGVL